MTPPPACLPGVLRQHAPTPGGFHGAGVCPEGVLCSTGSGTGRGNLRRAASGTSLPAATERVGSAPHPGAGCTRRLCSCPGVVCVLLATSALLQALVKEANAHGEKLSSLEAVASRLKDFSRKQDGAVIQNLVLTARERLSKVLQRTSERGAALEEARKRTKQVLGRGAGGRRSCEEPCQCRGRAAPARGPCHTGPRFALQWCTGRAALLCSCCGSHCLGRPGPFQFSESRRLLLDWMDEVEQSLEVPQDTATSQEEIKCQLAEHKVGALSHSPALQRSGGVPAGVAAQPWAVGSRSGGCGAAGEGASQLPVGQQCADALSAAAVGCLSRAISVKGGDLGQGSPWPRSIGPPSCPAALGEAGVSPQPTCPGAGAHVPGVWMGSPPLPTGFPEGAALEAASVRGHAAERAGAAGESPAPRGPAAAGGAAGGAEGALGCAVRPGCGEVRQGRDGIRWDGVGWDGMPVLCLLCRSQAGGHGIALPPWASRSLLWDPLPQLQ